MIRKGRVTKIERCNTTSMCLTQGITAENQSKYDNSSRHKGNNGSYTSNHQTDCHIYAYITMYKTDLFPEERLSIDIRKVALQHYGMTRISPQKLELIQKLNVGNKISFNWDPLLKTNTAINAIKF